MTKRTTIAISKETLNAMNIYRSLLMSPSWEQFFKNGVIPLLHNLTKDAVTEFVNPMLDFGVERKKENAEWFAETIVKDYLEYKKEKIKIE